MPRTKALKSIVFGLFCLLQSLGCTIVNDGSSASSARELVASELDLWMENRSSKAKDISLEVGSFITQSPISYKIRSVTEVNTKAVVLDDPEAPVADSNKEGDHIYRVVVDLQFETARQSSITKVITYHVAWLSSKKKMSFAIATK